MKRWYVDEFDLHDVHPLQVEFPGGQPMHLSIGMASGPLGEGLLGSPGAMQYQCVAGLHLVSGLPVNILLASTGSHRHGSSLASCWT